MVYRRILEWPNKDLKKPSVNANLHDDSHIIEDLLDTFNVAGGYGLAAPQIGFNIRAIIVNEKALKGDDTASEKLLMINPTIVSATGKEKFKEACFSLPGLSLEVERSSRVLVKWLDSAGASKESWFEGYAAACVQHEVDHLDGILTIDKISQLRRSMILKKSKRIDLENLRASRPSNEEKSKQKTLRTKKKNRKNRKAGKK